LASRKILVNAVAPGVIDTEMSQQVRELADDEVKAKILLKRYVRPKKLPMWSLFWSQTWPVMSRVRFCMLMVALRWPEYWAIQALLLIDRQAENS
jgi:NAD(P)-dependent dehydrogenase (short-subunit alcohol dehydrogenase family)